MTDKPTDPADATDTFPLPPAAPTTPPAAMTPAGPSEAPPSALPPAPPGPAWRTQRDDPGRLGTIVLGAILLVIGLWFFADQTLELDMPRLNWSQLWPVFLIALGAWIAIGSMRRPR